MSKTFQNGTNKTYVNKFTGYYLEDCECEHCLNYCSEKKVCKLNKCCCEDEKRDAVANGRVKRRRGSLVWDG